MFLSDRLKNTFPEEEFSEAIKNAQAYIKAKYTELSSQNM